MDRILLPKLGRSLIASVALVFGLATASWAQAVSYTFGTLSVDITISNSCSTPPTGNGFITFKINSTEGGVNASLAILGPVNLFPAQNIPAGGTFVFNPPKNLPPGTYRWILGDGTNTIGSLADPGTYPDLVVRDFSTAPLGITKDIEANNTSCVAQNGQVQATITGGSKNFGFGSYTYSWSSSNGTPTASGTTAGAAPLNLATLLGLGGLRGGTYTLMVQDKFSACSTTQVFTITDPSPTVFTVTTPSPLNVCAGANITITLSNSEAGVTYEILKNVASLPTPITFPGTGSGPFVMTFPATQFTSGNNISVLASNGFCTPVLMTNTVTLNINPLPTATVSGGGTVCAGTPAPNVVFTFTGTAPFTFTYTDGTTPVTVTNHPTTTYTITNPTAGTYSVTALTDSKSCGATSLGGSAAVVINPLPTATISGGGTVCTGDPLPNVVFTFTGTAPYTFTYNNGGAPITVTNHPSNTFTITNAAAGTYTITALTDSKTCVATSLGTPVAVVVRTRPTATVAGGGTVCAGNPVPNIVFTFTGTAPFTFTYTDGTTPVTITNHPTTTYTINNPPAGTYSITTLTDASTCNATSLGGSVASVINPLPTATISGGGTICSGSPLPNVVFTFTGTAPFTFTYNNGGAPITVTNHPTNTFTITNAAAGTYTITALTDSKTCVATSLGTPVSVIVRTRPTATVSGGGTVCAGNPVPNIVFTFTGTAPFTFTYTDGTTPVTITNHPTTTYTINNPPAGTYSITTLTDASTCNATSLGGSVASVINPLPTATISGGGTICSGSPLPNVTFTFTGTAPFTFTYNNGGAPITVTNHPTNTFTINNAAAGTYTITALTDSKTCVATSLGTPVSVIVNTRPTAVVSGGGTICAGGTLPNVTFTFTGTAPFTFTYTDGTTPVTVNNHPSTTFTITNAPAGTYSVTSLTDASTCNATSLGGSVAVVVNPLPTATISGGGTICSGSPLPNVTFTFTGTAPYTFTYNNGGAPITVTNHPSNTFTITNAAAGTYTITALTDSKTCVATSLGTPVSVIVNTRPTAVVSGGGTICAGGTLPNVTFTFTGTAPFTFTYTDGTTPVTVNNHPSTTFTITNAPAGTYSVTSLTDASTCNATSLGGSVAVVVNPLPTATISGGGTICTGSPLPNVVFTFTGTAPYTFTYNNGGAPITVTNHPSNTFTITNAAAGTYTITALTDSKTCVATSLGTPVSVIVNTRPTAVVSGGGTICAGGTLPNVTFTFTGTAPFTFTYTDGTTPVTVTNHPTTTFTINNAPAGNYSVTSLTDAGTCSATSLGGSVAVVVNPLPTATISGGGTVCTGSPLPNVVFTFTGTAPYTFTYNNGGAPITVTNHPSNTFTITNAAAGTYTITALTDSKTCVATSLGTPVSVIVNTRPTAVVSGGGTICAGGTLPNVTFTFTGTAPFTFTYTDGTTPVTVTNHPTTTFTINNAPAGNYSVTALTDAGTCSATSLGGSVAVVVKPVPTAAISGGGAICAGSALPNVTFTFTGTAPFTFTYTDGVTPITVTNHPSTTFTINNAPAGTYSVTALTDAGGCPATSLGTPVSVIVNPRPTAVVSGGGTICAGGTLPNVTFTFTGTAPFTFTYTDGTTPVTVTNHPSTTFTITNAASGTYSVTALTDNTTCTATSLGGSVAVVVKPVPTAAISGGGAICAGSALPNVTFTFTGTAPFTFTYTDGVTPITVTNHPSTTFTINNAPAGTYSVTALTDAGGCPATSLGTPVSVIVNPRPTAVVSGGGTICAGAALPNVVFTFTGTAPFTFTYTDGTTPVTVTNHPSTTFTITNAAAGTYSVTALTDNTTCTATSLGSSVAVIVNPLPTASISGSGSICSGSPVTLTFTLPTPGTFNIVYTDGTTNFPLNGISNGATVVVNPAVSTTYTLVSATNPATTCSVTAPSANLTGSAVVNVGTLPTADISGTATICAGTNTALTFTLPATGTFNVVYTDGVTNFNANGISNGATVNVSPATTATYTIVSVTNTATSCSVTAPNAAITGSAVITVNPRPTATIAGGGTVCSGSTLPDVTFTFTGTAPFTFTYDDGTTPITVTNHPSTTFTLTGAAAGTYTITALADATTCTATSLGTPVTVVTKPAPTVAVTGGGSICSGGTLPDVTFTFGGTAPFNFTYTDGTTPISVSNHPSTTFTITGAAAGTYQVTALTDATGCAATNLTSSVSVIVNSAPSVAISGGGTVCAGATLPDVIFTFTGTAPFTFTYTDGTTPVTINNHPSSTFTIATAPQGNYSVTALTDAGACPGASLGTPVAVVVNALPTAVVGGGGTVCAGSTLPDVTFTFTGTAPFNFTYTDGTTPVSVSNHPGTTFTITAAAVGTYQVTALTDANSCTATSLGGSVSVIVNPAATADAGVPQIICAGSTVTLAGSIGGAATTATWSGGSGSFNPNANDLNAIYTPSLPEATAGSVTLTLTTDDPDGAGPCLAATDNVVITISSGATVDAGPVQTICAGNSATLAGTFSGASGITWTTAGDGTFNNANLTNAVYTPGANDITAGTVSLTITTGGPCAAAADNVIITINPAATVDAGTPQITCAATAVTLSGSFTGSATGLKWTTAGDGTFSDDTDPSSTYTPGVNDVATGSVVLTATATGTCTGVTDNVTITINPLATVDAGSPQNICGAMTVTLGGVIGGSATSATWTGGTGTFAPNPSTLNAIYTPSAAERAAGTVTLTLTTNNPAGPCPAASDNVTITIGPIPGDQVTFGNDTWIGYVYDDSSNPVPPVTNVDFASAKYRGFIGPNEITALSFASPAYNLATDAFNLDLSSINDLTGPNLCGNFLDEFSIRFKMQKVFTAGTYTFTVGGDDGVRLLIDNVVVAGAFSTHSYTQYTGTVCLTAGSHDLVIEYFEHQVISHVSFDYGPAAPPSVTSASVSVCLNTPTAPTLSASSTDPTVTGFNWYSDAALTNLVGTGANFTPTLGTNPGELNVTVVGTTSYYVAAQYTCGQGAPATVAVNVVNGATLVYNNTSICEANGAVDLTTFVTPTPTGGTFTFSGQPSITGNMFDPTGLSGPVAITVNYAIGACSAPQGTLTLNVTNTSNITVPAAALAICQGNGVIDLNTLVSALPAGGDFVFAGSAGITGDNFDPTGLNGNQVITVNYSLAGSCVAVQKQFTINVSPNATLTTNNISICPNAGPLNLLTLVSGAPAGGAFTFTGPGVTGTSFDPSGLAGTTVSITVQYVSTGCGPVSGAISAVVKPTNDPTCGGTGTDCINYSAIIPTIVTPPSCNNINAGELSFKIARADGTPSLFQVILNYYIGNTLIGTKTAFTNGSASGVDFDKLASGRYTYTVIDQGNSKSCGPAEFFIDLQTEVTILDKQVIHDVTCFGGTDGNVILTVDGSPSDEYWYTYVYKGQESSARKFTKGNPLPEGLPADDTDFITLKVGSVNLDQSFNLTCPDTAMVRIKNLFPKVNMTVSPTDVTTCNGSDGVINVTGISGGNTTSGALKIRLRRLTSTFGDTEVLFDYVDVVSGAKSYTDLSKGDYFVDIKDNSDCQTTYPSAIQIKAPGLSLTIPTLAVTNADCSNGGKSGTVLFKISAPDGIYKVAISADPLNVPADDQFVDYNTLVLPNVKFDQLARGGYYFYVKSNTSPCPTRTDNPVAVDGPYQIGDFEIIPSCSTPDITIANISGEPGKPMVIQVYDNADPFFQIDELAVSANATTATFHYTPTQHSFLTGYGNTYRFVIVQEQTSCTITSADKLQVINQRLDLTVTSKPSFPNPKRTGSILIDNIFGGTPFHSDDNQLYYSVTIADENGATVIDSQPVTLNPQKKFSQSFDYLSPGIYTITVEDDSQCNPKIVQIQIDLDPSVYVPNIFTPNDDAVNDQFEVLNLPAGGKHTLIISNRWGNEVFKSTDYHEGNFWDAKEASDGIYFYRLQLDGGETFTGWVEVLRGSKP
jgi:gliding motility-associated-like protein